MPEDFALASSGGDYVEWKNTSGKYPALETKMIVFEIVGPSLTFEQNVIRGKNNDFLVFRYAREHIDSFVVNYSTVSQEFRRNTDSLFKRYYSYADSTGKRETVDRHFYDSVLRRWGLAEL